MIQRLRRRRRRSQSRPLWSCRCRRNSTCTSTKRRHGRGGGGHHGCCLSPLPFGAFPFLWNFTGVTPDESGCLLPVASTTSEPLPALFDSSDAGDVVVLVPVLLPATCVPLQASPPLRTRAWLDRLRPAQTTAFTGGLTNKAPTNNFEDNGDGSQGQAKCYDRLRHLRIGRRSCQQKELYAAMGQHGHASDGKLSRRPAFPPSRRICVQGFL
jgi:hypothetical protein